MSQQVLSKAWSYQRQPDGKDEWLTPPSLIRVLGRFDLDPCAPIKRPWDTAGNHFTEEDNGLKKEWFGRVWCNPPYSEADAWLGRCAAHGNCIALVFARTETKMFFNHVFAKANGIVFIKGRLRFYHVDGTIGVKSSVAGSVLIGYGKENAECLKQAVSSGKLNGVFFDLKQAAFLKL